jgi:hypothetical protein
MRETIAAAPRCVGQGSAIEMVMMFNGKPKTNSTAYAGHRISEDLKTTSNA